MAEQSSSGLSDVLDVALPAFAFLASASSRYGAAGVQGMLAAMSMRERGKSRKAEEQRLQDILSYKKSQADLARPGQELEAMQATAQQGALGNVLSQIQQPTATPDAVQALGAPTAMRLQEALGRGEQVPLPQGLPTPQQQSMRLGQMATTPQGAAMLNMAGLPHVSQAALGVVSEQRQQEALARKGTAEEQQIEQQFGQDKREALKMLQSLPQGVMQGDGASKARQAILGAKSQDELNAAYAMIPGGGQKGTPAEQVYQTLVAGGVKPLEALRATSHATQKPDSPEELQQKRLQIQKLGLEIKNEEKKLSGAPDPQKRREFQLHVRSNLRAEPVYKDYEGALSGFQSVGVGAGRNDAQGDLAILNGIVRLMDPGSVVRPSEFETARASQGLLQNLQNYWKRVATGDQLTPQIRQQFLGLAEQLFGEWSATVKREVEPIYGSAIRDSGLTLEDVFVQPPPIPPRGEASIGLVTPAQPGQPAQPQLDPTRMTPDDLSKLTPEQLDTLEQRLKGSR